LGSYYLKNKITVGASPTVFLSKKNTSTMASLTDIKTLTGI
jgi:hypothetical protein